MSSVAENTSISKAHAASADDHEWFFSDSDDKPMEKKLEAAGATDINGGPEDEGNKENTPPDAEAPENIVCFFTRARRSCRLIANFLDSSSTRRRKS